jgi:hypothetical protein
MKKESVISGQYPKGTMNRNTVLSSDLFGGAWIEPSIRSPA